MCSAVVDGVSKQLDQYLKRNGALGNAVVPLQAKYAFSILSGLLPYKGPSMATVAARQKRPPPISRKRSREEPQVLPSKNPYLQSNEANGARRSSRLQAMRDAES